MSPLKEERVGDHGSQGFLNSFFYYRSLVAQTLSPLKEGVADHGFLNSFYYYRSLVAQTLSPLLVILVHRVS